MKQLLIKSFSDNHYYKKSHHHFRKQCPFFFLNFFFEKRPKARSASGIIQVESSVRQLIKDTPKGNIVGWIWGDGDRSPKNKPGFYVWGPLQTGSGVLTETLMTTHATQNQTKSTHTTFMWLFFKVHEGFRIRRYEWRSRRGFGDERCAFRVESGVCMCVVFDYG